jgi:hypothetical protein
MYYISPNDSQGLKRGNLNYGNHVLNLPAGIKMYVGSRLHDRDRKIRSCTLFFRPDGILPADGFIREKTEPIPAKKITQLTKQPIPIGKRERQCRQ